MRLIAVPFSSPDEFLAHYSDERASGALFVRTKAEFEPNETVLLEVSWPGVPNKVLLRGTVLSALDGAGAWVALHGDHATARSFIVGAARGDVDTGTAVARGSERFPALVNVSVESDDIEDPASAQTEDLGRGGAFVRTANPPPVGTTVRLIIGPLDDERINTLRIEAEVAWTRTDDDPGFGVRFSDQSQDEIRQLRALLRWASERGRISFLS